VPTEGRKRREHIGVKVRSVKVRLRLRPPSAAGNARHDCAAAGTDRIVVILVRPSFDGAGSEAPLDGAAAPAPLT
jgi:hypothetical protein